jgi:hypothetical protein
MPLEGEGRGFVVLALQNKLICVEAHRSFIGGRKIMRKEKGLDRQMLDGLNV